jgi:hypothetical protein
LKGGEDVRDIKKMTREEILGFLCAPGATDEPEESDFIAESDLDEIAEETFVKNYIAKELN